MDERGLRVAVVGAGSHARTTIYPALLAAGYQIQAVVTQTLRTAEAAARHFGARAYDDLDRMLAEVAGDVEAIVLVLPPDGYEAPLTKCIAAGFPVYCEKPVALHAASLRRLESVRAQAGVTVMAGYMKRFAPAYQRARDLVVETAFGGATAYNAYWGMGPGFHNFDVLLRENATHHLDLARFMLGEVKDVAAIAFEPEQASLAMAVLLHFESGAVGTLQINNNSAWDHDNEWISVTGRGPVVLVDNVDTCIYRLPGQGEQRWRPNYTLPALSTSSLMVAGFVGAFNHFAEVVRAGAPCQSDLYSALRTMELAEQVLAAAAPRA